jgi:hypothetical protein
MTNVNTTLRQIDSQYDTLQRALLHFRNDEGHDIGDACDAFELIANTCIDDSHDSFTRDELICDIAYICEIDRNVMYDVCSRIAIICYAMS